MNAHARARACVFVCLCVHMCPSSPGSLTISWVHTFVPVWLAVSLLSVLGCCCHGRGRQGCDAAFVSMFFFLVGHTLTLMRVDAVLPAVCGVCGRGVYESSACVRET